MNNIRNTPETTIKAQRFMALQRMVLQTEKDPKSLFHSDNSISSTTIRRPVSTKNSSENILNSDVKMPIKGILKRIDPISLLEESPNNPSDASASDTSAPNSPSEEQNLAGALHKKTVRFNEIIDVRDPNSTTTPIVDDMPTFDILIRRM